MSDSVYAPALTAYTEYIQASDYSYIGTTNGEPEPRKTKSARW